MSRTMWYKQLMLISVKHILHICMVSKCVPSSANRSNRSNPSNTKIISDASEYISNSELGPGEWMILFFPASLPQVIIFPAICPPTIELATGPTYVATLYPMFFRQLSEILIFFLVSGQMFSMSLDLRPGKLSPGSVLANL